MKLIGIKSVSAYRAWEHNRSNPSIKYYPKIMEFLGYCPIQYAHDIGQRLKLFREHQGLPFHEVDKILGLSKGSTYGIEALKNLISKKLILIMIEFYKNYKLVSQTSLTT